MIRGIYAAGSGMITQSERVSVLSNNLSNVDTPGYKKDSVETKTFGDQLLYSLNTGNQIGSVSQGSATGAQTTDLTQGPVEKTGVSTDLVLTTPGFFAVQGTGGVEYTRNGSFAVDAQGYLCTQSGQRVLGTNGPLPVGGDRFSVSADGTVSNAQGAVGKLAVYNGTATKLADGCFSLTGTQLTAATVEQGCLENSNEDMIGAMTAMMEASRAYQSCSQAFHIADQSVQQAVNQVGSLK